MDYFGTSWNAVEQLIAVDSVETFRLLWTSNNGLEPFKCQSCTSRVSRGRLSSSFDLKLAYHLNATWHGLMHWILLLERCCSVFDKDRDAIREKRMGIYWYCENNRVRLAEKVSLYCNTVTKENWIPKAAWLRLLVPERLLTIYLAKGINSLPTHSLSSSVSQQPTHYNQVLIPAHTYHLPVLAMSSIVHVYDLDQGAQHYLIASAKLGPPIRRYQKTGSHRKRAILIMTWSTVAFMTCDTYQKGYTSSGSCRTANLSGRDL